MGKKQKNRSEHLPNLWKEGLSQLGSDQKYHRGKHDFLYTKI